MALKKLIQKYDVTIIFTLLSIINVFGPLESLKYRSIIVVINIMCGTLLEYLLDKFTPKEHYGLWKSLIILFLLIINCTWIMLI